MMTDNEPSIGSGGRACGRSRQMRRARCLIVYSVAMSTASACPHHGLRREIHFLPGSVTGFSRREAPTGIHPIEGDLSGAIPRQLLDYIVGIRDRCDQPDRGSGTGSVEDGQTWRSLGRGFPHGVELRNLIEAGLHVSIPVETLQSETVIVRRSTRCWRGCESHKPWLSVRL